MCIFVLYCSHSGSIQYAANWSNNSIQPSNNCPRNCSSMCSVTPWSRPCRCRVHELMIKCSNVQMCEYKPLNRGTPNKTDLYIHMFTCLHSHVTYTKKSNSITHIFSKTYLCYLELCASSVTRMHEGSAMNFGRQWFGRVPLRIVLHRSTRHNHWRYILNQHEFAKLNVKFVWL